MNHFQAKQRTKNLVCMLWKMEKKTLINFGDSRFEDYTQHKDKDRQKSYLTRAKGIKNKQGEFT